jgi:hypothetical protein
VKRVLFCPSLAVKPAIRSGGKNPVENLIWTIGGYSAIAGGTIEPTT